MKTAAVICEYNPFHKGHLYHLQKTKELTACDAVIAVMSGPFVQRGEAAVLDKWARAKCALLCGADLVVELPFCYAIGSGEYFATGACRLIDSMKVVSCLSFGSEAGDIDLITQSADALLDETEENKTLMKESLRKGLSYPAARLKSVDSGGMKGSNNILATEYVKAIKKYNLSLTPFTIKRQGGSYNSQNADESEFISATAARNLIFSGSLANLEKYLPEECMEVLKEEEASGRFPARTELLSPYITGLIRKEGAEYLKNTAYVSEGLENRIYKAACLSSDINELIEKIKTKRYITARIRRILISAAVGLTISDLHSFSEKGPAYIRVLGANKNGQRLIKEIKNRSSLPVITKTAGYKSSGSYCAKMLALDFLAGDIFSLCYPSVSMRQGKKDLTTSPIML